VPAAGDPRRAALGGRPPPPPPDRRLAAFAFAIAQVGGRAAAAAGHLVSSGLRQRWAWARRQRPQCLLPCTCSPAALPLPHPFSPPQAVGQLTYLRPYVTDFSPEWLAGSTLALVAGAMSLVYIADTISELK
jgi:hypothetical protein